MTPFLLQRLAVLRTIMGRSSVVDISRRPGNTVDVTLRMSRPDFADLAWATGQSADDAPGAWTLPQIGESDER